MLSSRSDQLLHKIRKLRRKSGGPEKRDGVKSKLGTRLVQRRRRGGQLAGLLTLFRAAVDGYRLHLYTPIDLGFDMFSNLPCILNHCKVWDVEFFASCVSSLLSEQGRGTDKTLNET